MKITKQAFHDLIQAERGYQDKKWGKQEHSDEKWLAILVEEIGEIAKAVLENDDPALLQEIIQSAAVLQAWTTSRGFFNQEELSEEQ